ncbi:MAG: hypothetical protein Q7J85_04115 [Bacillota bacterium]|nr:hypothetical protein [Bacillota bacterium]
MKKLIIISLVSFILIFSAIPVYAAETAKLSTESDIAPQFTAIWSMGAGLSIDSWGKAICSGFVTPQSNSYSSELTVSLQKSTGSGWSTIKSWSESGVGFAGVIIEGHHYVASGTYRVCSTAKIYNSSGTLLETESFYSAERTY